MLQLIEKITDRMVYGNDQEWAMNIHRFDWVPGVGLAGVWRAYQVTGKREYLDFLVNWADSHAEEAYKQKSVNSTAPLLTILDLYEETGNNEYRKLCEDIADYIIKEAPLTIDGGLEHTVTENASFSNQMWADTLFMVCIFLARLGRVSKNQNYTDFATDQLVRHYHFLWNEEMGLFYHGWDGKQRNHLSGIFWGRANAWILYSTVEILNTVGEFEGRDEVIRKLNCHVGALADWQRPDGLFTTILDVPDSYEELSASAGITCGILRAVRSGFVEDKWSDVSQKALERFPDYISPAGEVQGVSGGTPIMKDAQAYKEIKRLPTLYGQALMCLALAEGK